MSTPGQARVRPAFASLYPGLIPGQWYPLARRGEDDLRTDGPTRSAGGPVPTAGIWIRVGDGERFLFRHHVEIRQASE